MKNILRWLTILAILISVSCKKPESVPASSGKPQKNIAADEIVIGEFGPLTGSTAALGQGSHKGVMIATQEINAAGGLLGKKVRIISEDTQGRPEQAVTTILKLIQRDRVVAIIGEIKSSCSIAAAPIAQEHKIPMISPSATNPEVTQKGDYIFRACFIDSYQGDIMAKFALDTLKVRSVAIFTDRKNDYSVGLAKFFKERFLERGGKVAAEENYQAGEVEFKPQLANIRSTNPEAIFVPGYYTECALIARQIRELGMTMPILGGDGWDSEVTIKNGGKAVEGTYFSTHYHPEDPRPEVQEFLKKYKQSYQGEVPDSSGVLGYDTANILFDAIRRAGSTDPQAIRDQLAKTSDFLSVAGKLTIDEHRNARKGAVVLKIEDGRFKFVKQIAP